MSSVSSIRCIARCPREYHYRYDEGYEGVEDSIDVRVGRFGHKVLELMYEGKALAEALDTAQHYYDLPKNPYHGIRLLLEEYDLPDVEVVAVEQRFELEFKDHDDVQKGAIDLIYRTPKGLVVADWKFTKTADLTTWGRWHKLDPQLHLYANAVQELYGETVSHCEYHLFRRPMQRLRQNETIGKMHDRIRRDIRANQYFRAEHVATSKTIQRDALDDYFGWVALQRSGLRPRNGDACYRFGRPCEFHPVCTGDLPSVKTAPEHYQIRTMR